MPGIPQAAGWQTCCGLHVAPAQHSAVTAQGMPGWRHIWVETHVLVPSHASPLQHPAGSHASPSAEQLAGSHFWAAPHESPGQHAALVAQSVPGKPQLEGIWHWPWSQESPLQHGFMGSHAPPTSPHWPTQPLFAPHVPPHPSGWPQSSHWQFGVHWGWQWPAMQPRPLQHSAGEPHVWPGW